jgi:hypothetical protein
MRVDDDLVLGITGTGDKVTVPEWFAGGSNVSEITFSNGNSLNATRIYELAIVSEPDIDITPVSVDARVFGTDGADRLIGNDKNQMFMGRRGDDTIVSNGGSNVFYYRAGDGNDTLIISKKSDTGKNVLRFHADIVPADLQAVRSEGDLFFRVKGGSIKVEGWYADTSRKLDRVEFFDGTVKDSRDIERLALGMVPVTREYYVDSRKHIEVPELEGHEPVQFGADPLITADDGENGTSSSGGCNAGFSTVVVFLVLALCAIGSQKARK